VAVAPAARPAVREAAATVAAVVVAGARLAAAARDKFRKSEKELKRPGPYRFGPQYFWAFLFLLRRNRDFNSRVGNLGSHPAVTSFANRRTLVILV
jgi:hypothetical protein